ncbi:RmlC-like cupin domain-containing protein [Pelagophyceae sp. CCMP2097]|nr:RmlC-like cupin domain-containing protein [Pelagophyceae sp. CCMP2097]
MAFGEKASPGMVRVVSESHMMDEEPEAVNPAAASDWTKSVRVYEYGSAANPQMLPIPVVVHPSSLHESGPTAVLNFDLSAMLGGAGPCSSPNLLAAYVRIVVGESIATQACATSQAFYVIRGAGETMSAEHGTVDWSEGDLFVIPKTAGSCTHSCASASAFGGAALYWVHDEPLMTYLGVAPNVQKFEPTHFTRARLLAHVEEIRHAPGAEHRNRLGVLLGNVATEETTMTLTHVLWSLLNSIGPKTIQRPHRHNSVALDLAVSAPLPAGQVYTLMGREIDKNGDIINPIKCDWVNGSVFLTPPGWWHSHHNESNETAWVLPMQDAGLYTHQRTLDIRFVDDELALHSTGRIRGSSFHVTNKQYTELAAIANNCNVPNFDYGL